MSTSAWAVIVASGKDEMLNADTCTAFLNLNNKPILSYSLSAFEHCADIEGVIVVAPKDRLEQVVGVIQLFGCHKVKKVVPGGANEFVSFNNGMKYVDPDAGLIVIHEASRPGIQPAVLTELIKLARKNGVVMAGKAVREETAVINKSGGVEEYCEPGSVWTYGSPIAIKIELLKKSLSALGKKKKNVKNIVEGLIEAGQSPRVMGVDRFPLKVDSVEHLREIEHSVLSV